MFKHLQYILNKLAATVLPIFLLVIRLYWGYGFVVTGFGKLTHLEMIAKYFATLNIPFAYSSAIIVGCVEFVGGICLLFGLYARLAALVLFCVLTVALFTADYPAIYALTHKFDPLPLFATTPFLFMYTVLVIFCFGPGKISLDYLLLTRRKHHIHKSQGGI